MCGPTHSLPLALRTSCSRSGGTKKTSSSSVTSSRATISTATPGLPRALAALAGRERPGCVLCVRRYMQHVYEPLRRTRLEAETISGVKGAFVPPAIATV
jgi:hypothetical protein